VWDGYSLSVKCVLDNRAMQCVPRFFFAILNLMIWFPSRADNRVEIQPTYHTNKTGNYTLEISVESLLKEGGR